jgi:hypothetical protein
MYVDGHFPQWGVAERDARAAMDRVIDLFLTLLRRS